MDNVDKNYWIAWARNRTASEIMDEARNQADAYEASVEDGSPYEYNRLVSIWLNDIVKDRA